MATQSFEGSLGVAGNPLTVGGFSYAFRSNAGTSSGTLSVARGGLLGLGDASLGLNNALGGYLSISQTSGTAFALNSLVVERLLSVAGNTVFVGIRNGVPIATQAASSLVGVGDQRVSFTDPAWQNVTEVRVYSRNLLDVDIGFSFSIDDIETSPADTTPPLAPTLSAGTAATADATPTLTGTAEAGSTVTILNGSTALGTVIAAADGTFSFTPTVPLADGTYTLTATARDPSGNLGPASAAISLRIDATPPAAPTFVAGGGLTGDSTPTLTGRAEAGSTVTVSNGTTVLGTVQADANGAFAFTPAAPLAEGSYALTASARDGLGNVSPASAVLLVQIDLSAPAAPVLAPLAPTNDSTPTITGTAEAGAIVTIANGATVLGTTTALADGTFSFTPVTALPEGTARLTATARDAAGNVSGSSVAVSLTVDTGVPLAPVLDLRSPTNDPTPTLTGTAEAGALVTLRSNGVVIGTAVAGSDGIFSVTPVTALPDGTTSLTATARDAAGNLSPDSAAVTLTVDTAAPAAPTLASIALTNDATPTLTGTAEAGSTVTILDGTTVLGTTVAGAGGAFSFTPTTPLADGTTGLTATARDAAGNVSGASPVATVTVDTGAPAAPVFAPLGPTNSTTPVLTGTAEAGSIVTVANGTTVLGTTTALGDGTFSLTLTAPLAEGTTNLTAIARDPAGNVSAPSAILAVTVDTTAPAAPVLDPRGLTNDPTPTLTGTAEAGALVILRSDGAVIGTVTAGPQGIFSFTPVTALPDGTTSLTATARDAAGNLSPDSAAVTLTVDTAAPAAPTLASIALTDDATPTLTGTAEAGSTVTILDGTTVLGTTVAGAGGAFSFTPVTALPDGTTGLTATARDAAGNVSGASPVATVTVDTGAPAAPVLAPLAPTNDSTPTLTGTAEAGSTVTLSTGITVLGTTTALWDGTFSLTPTVPLPNGTSQIVATARDPAGNVSAVSDPVDVTVTTGVSGFLAVDYVPPTNDPTPTITGITNPGDTVTVRLGTTLIGTDTAENTGRFSIDVSDIPEGLQTLTVSSTDPDDPAQVVTTTLDVLIDLTPPAAPTLATLAGPTNDPSPVIRGSGAEAGATVTVTSGNLVVGTAVADAFGNFAITPVLPLQEGTTSLVATVRDVAGNASDPSDPIDVVIDRTPPPVPSVDPLRPTNDTTPTITGRAFPGTVVLIAIDGAELGAVTANADGTYAFTPGTPLPAGPFTVTAQARDAAGNLSAVSLEVEGLIDTIPPAAPVLTTTSGATTDNTPTITGTADVGSIVTVSSNGTPLGTVTVDATGLFSVTPGQALADGTALITATAWDTAGNASAVSNQVALAIDTVAPAAPAFTIASGSTTTGTPTITGTAEAFALVTISSGATELGTVAAGADGAFSFTPADPLGDGLYTLTATARDAAGNAGPASAAVTLSIDTGVPAAPTLDPVTGPTRDNTPTLTGRAEPGSTVTLFDGTAVLGTTTADGAGAFAFTPSAPLADGTYTLTATATDAAGQVGAVSQPVVLGIDSSPPPTPTVTSPGGAVADATPEITGTGEAGTTVTLYDGATAVGTATVDPNGTFAVSPTGPLAQGAHSLSVQLTDAAGNASAATAPLDLVVDTLPPAAPVIATAGLTNDSTPTITGTAEPGAIVTVSSDGVELGSAVADAGGAFAFTPAQALAEGANQITAVARDAAGNLGPASAPVTVTIDTGVPSAPTLDPVTGATRDATPTLTGTADAGTTVTIRDGTAVLGTVAADGTGAFSFTPTTPLGDGTHSLTATAADAAGNVGAASAPVTLAIDTAAPATPAVTGPTGPTSDTTPAITGTGEPGATVTLLDGTVPIGSAVVGADGTFAVSPTSPLADGTYALAVQLTDAPGNAGAPSSLIVVVVDTQIDAGPAVSVTVATTADGIVNAAEAAATAFTVTGLDANTTATATFSDGRSAVTATVSADGSYAVDLGVLDGPATATLVLADAAGNTATVAGPTFLLDTSAPTGTAVADAAGGAAVASFTYGVSFSEAVTNVGADDFVLTGTDGVSATVTGVVGSGGDYTVTVAGVTGAGTLTLGLAAGSDVADAAGNRATLTAGSRDVTGAAPVQPVITGYSDDTGVPSDGITRDATPTLTGIGAAGATVSVTAAGAAGAVTATGLVGADGTWSVGLPALADGAYSLTASLTDGAGSPIGTSAPFALTIDTTVDGGAPATLTVDATADGIIDATEAETVAFTVAGLDPGTSGSVTFSDGIRETSVAVAADGTYTVDLSAFSGSVTSTLVLGDTAGNTATVAGGTLTLQLGRPGAPVIITLDEDTGAPGDGLTSDTTPTLAGMADPGCMVVVAAGTPAGPVTVETRADASGAWTATLPTLPDGVHAVTAVAMDDAGNVSIPSAPVTFGIDASAPTAPVVTAGGGTADDTTPTITGTGEPGATVTLLNGTTPIGTAVVGADGTFAVSPADPLAEGTYPLAVQLTDAAGNAGAPTAPITVVVASVPFVFTEGNDVATDTDAGHELAALGGDDTVDGAGGDDVIRGDAGDDRLLGGSGNDSLDGGTGNDVLFGEFGDDVLAGLDGDDFLGAGAGDDTASGGLGNDEVHGEDGNDWLYGDDGRDGVYGEAGDDHLHGGTGADTLFGGEGQDWVEGQGDDDLVMGDGGDDVLYGQDGNDLVLGGEGDDFGSGGFGNDTVRGEAGTDLLFGDDDDDLVDGGDGDDLVYGGTGTDTVFGSAGSDQVYGQSGNDFIGTGEGNDFGSGGDGNDEVHGEGGNDLLFGDEGDDGVYGEDGDDLVHGGTGNDYLTGDAGDDGIFGEAGDDRLFGGEGGDDLSGGAGNDTVEGGAGTDLLFGNAGDDVLTGGTGADIFAFGRGDGVDVVTDFVTGGPEADVIAFNGGVFADFAAVQAAMRQEGADVVIDFGTDGRVTLQTVQAGALSAANFAIA